MGAITDSCVGSERWLRKKKTCFTQKSTYLVADIMPKWQKGQSGNPKGRPKKGMVYELEKAIKKVEKEKGEKLLVHAVRQAFEDNSVLVSILKKILPDLRQVEGVIKAQIEVIPMTPAEKLVYEKAAAEIANQEIQKLLTEGEGEDE